jgi:hypothetical protein
LHQARKTRRIGHAGVGALDVREPRKDSVRADGEEAVGVEKVGAFLEGVGWKHEYTEIDEDVGECFVCVDILLCLLVMCLYITVLQI